MKISKKLFALGAVVALAAVAVVGCAGEQAEVESVADSTSAYATYPKVFVDDDGDLIQLCPADEVTDTVYFLQEGYRQYNTNFAHADERGCKACHADLKAMLMEDEYKHCGENGVDTEWTVETCLGCHSTANQDYFAEYDLFGELIHTIHMTTDTQCWQCHAMSATLQYGKMSEDDGSMLLWDRVKKDYLRGFKDIAADDLSDRNFAFTQDIITDVHTLFNLTPQYYENDYVRAANTRDNVPTDDATRDKWTVTLSGIVAQEKTFVLGDLINDPNVPKETHVMSFHCTLNPVGGNGIGQVEATGIPVKYLIEQCGGLTEECGAVLPVGSDGFQDPEGIDANLVLEDGGIFMLVYQMNGENLTWNNGFPCIVMFDQTACGPWVKEVGDIVFQPVGAPLFNATGWPVSESDPTRIDKPNVGIIGLKDGQVFKTGETLTIEGYADAYDLRVTAIELSFDRGATWKSFATPNTDYVRWVRWTYNFTPEESGTYYVMVRSVAEDGTKTVIPIEKMITFVDDPDALRPVGTISAA